MDNSVYCSDFDIACPSCFNEQHRKAAQAKKLLLLIQRYGNSFAVIDRGDTNYLIEQGAQEDCVFCKK